MTVILSCYRMLQQQRIDGVLSLRQGIIHFEADFPSRHREHLPLHRLLGYQHISGGSLQLFSDMGMLIFHPLEATDSWLDVLHERWTPNRDTLQIDEFSGLIPLHKESSAPDFLAYLEGQWKTEGATTHPCAIQVYDNGFALFVRGLAPQNIALEDIEALECTQHIWKDQAVLSLKVRSKMHLFFGYHATQLWAFLHTLKSGAIPHKVWIDKTNWWNSTKTWVVASDGLWSFEPTRWQKTTPECIPWNNIQQINFQRERLKLRTTQGTVFIGQRYSNHFYRNLVEQFLEQICAQEPTMAIWTNQRIVDIVTIALRGDCLEIYPHCSTDTSPITVHPLDHLWIPEIPDRTSAFVQLRVADSEPTPRWLIVHCGTSERAGMWLNTLNVPSRRIKWSNVSIPVREGLFDSRPAKCCSREHEEMSGVLIWQQNQLSFRCNKPLPLDIPLTFFFDDGRQQFRVTTTAIEHQDIPIAQWNLETPTTLDVYNLRAYHRLPTHWDVHLSPVEWNSTGWSVNMEYAQAGHMVDMSVAGCAIQSTRELSESNIWLVQLTLWEETHQFLCIKQNSHPLQGTQWRSGFQFALPHMKTLQILWRTLQREHNQETEKMP